MTALATCLLTVPIWSAATDEAAIAGEIGISDASVHMTLCGALVAAFAIGVLLVRKTAGRWLIAAGGADQEIPCAEGRSQRHHHSMIERAYTVPGGRGIRVLPVAQGGQTA